MAHSVIAYSHSHTTISLGPHNGLFDRRGQIIGLLRLGELLSQDLAHQLVERLEGAEGPSKQIQPLATLCLQSSGTFPKSSEHAIAIWQWFVLNV